MVNWNWRVAVQSTKSTKQMAVFIVRFLNIILATLLAGVSFGIWIGFNPSDLSPSTYLEQQQICWRH
jgi:hypothetical protein